MKNKILKSSMVAFAVLSLLPDRSDAMKDAPVEVQTKKPLELPPLPPLSSGTNVDVKFFAMPTNELVTTRTITIWVQTPATLAALLTTTPATPLPPLAAKLRTAPTTQSPLTVPPVPAGQIICELVKETINGKTTAKYVARWAKSSITPLLPPSSGQDDINSNNNNNNK